MKIEAVAANVMLRALTMLAAQVELDNIAGGQPLVFEAPADRSVRARPMVFEIPPFGVVTGYRVLSADGALLWREEFQPPEEYGARGGLFELPDLTVRI